jgi:hypothetical protein
MAQVFVVGDEPVAGYKLLENISGTAFYRMWKVRAPNGALKMWKEIDLVVGNVAVETRLLGLLVKLRNPNLSTLTNFWQLNEGRTLVIETDFPDSSLRQRLEQCRRDGQTGIPAAELSEYLEQAAEGLDFLNSPQHEFEGKKVAVYHRALRPDCLLLFRDAAGGYSCRVSDFGLAKPVSEADQAHSQGLMNYDYDPPEFFEGQTAATSDQYSLAINYYELRTGQLPFPGTMLEQLQARLSDSPNLTALVEPERSVVRRALMRDPSQRYSNSTEFIQQVKTAAGREPVGVAGRPAVRATSIGGEEAGQPAPARTAAAAPAAGAGLRAALGVGGGGGGGAAVEPPPARPQPADSPRPPATSRPQPSAEPAKQVETPVTQTPVGTADLKKIRQGLKRQKPTGESTEDRGEFLFPVKWVVIILALVVAAVAAAVYFFVRPGQ